MTPKEKAEKLWVLFSIKLFPLSKMYVKNASLACVDEIIKSNPMIWESSDTDEYITAKPYWQQVKEELQKMQL